MMVILDLDYTLLDTSRFKDALAEIFRKCGVDRERFLTTYRATAEAYPPKYDYDVDRHLETLRDELTCGESEVRSAIEEVLNDTENFLYPGAVEFVEELRSRDARLVLLTLGNEAWQRVKVDRSGLSAIFDDVITLAEGKDAVISDLTRGHEEVVVVNDNPDEIIAMRGIEPTFLYIMKQGPKNAGIECDFPVCSDFDEIIGIIDNTFRR